MNNIGISLGFLAFVTACGFTDSVSAETYPLPEERTRQNLNTATIDADIIGALPDPTGVLAGKSAVSAREYDKLIPKLMNDFIGDDTISPERFLARYPDAFLSRGSQHLLVEDLKDDQDIPVTYACTQERVHHRYLMEFLPSNINSSSTMRHNCNALEISRRKAREEREALQKKSTSN